MTNPAYVFELVHGRVLSTRYETDERALDEALDAVRRLRSTVKLVKSSGHIVSREELDRLAKAPRS